MAASIRLIRKGAIPEAPISEVGGIVGALSVDFCLSVADANVSFGAFVSTPAIEAIHPSCHTQGSKFPREQGTIREVATAVACWLSVAARVGGQLSGLKRRTFGLWRSDDLHVGRATECRRRQGCGKRHTPRHRNLPLFPLLIFRLEHDGMRRLPDPRRPEHRLMPFSFRFIGKGTKAESPVSHVSAKIRARSVDGHFLVADANVALGTGVIVKETEAVSFSRDADGPALLDEQGTVREVATTVARGIAVTARVRRKLNWLGGQRFGRHDIDLRGAGGERRGDPQKWRKHEEGIDSAHPASPTY